jgi:hypothetical protein
MSLIPRPVVRIDSRKARLAKGAGLSGAPPGKHEIIETLEKTASSQTRPL